MRRFTRVRQVRQVKISLAATADEIMLTAQMCGDTAYALPIQRTVAIRSHQQIGVTKTTEMLRSLAVSPTSFRVSSVSTDTRNGSIVSSPAGDAVPVMCARCVNAPVFGHCDS